MPFSSLRHFKKRRKIVFKANMEESPDPKNNLYMVIVPEDENIQKAIKLLKNMLKEQKSSKALENLKQARLKELLEKRAERKKLEKKENASKEEAVEKEQTERARLEKEEKKKEKRRKDEEAKRAAEEAAKAAEQARLKEKEKEDQTQKETTIIKGEPVKKAPASVKIPKKTNVVDDGSLETTDEAGALRNVGIDPKTINPSDADKLKGWIQTIYKKMFEEIFEQKSLTQNYLKENLATNMKDFSDLLNSNSNLKTDLIDELSKKKSVLESFFTLDDSKVLKYGLRISKGSGEFGYIFSTPTDKKVKFKLSIERELDIFSMQNTSIQIILLMHLTALIEQKKKDDEPEILNKLIKYQNMNNVAEMSKYISPSLQYAGLVLPRKTSELTEASLKDIQETLEVIERNPRFLNENGCLRHRDIETELLIPLHKKVLNFGSSVIQSDLLSRQFERMGLTTGKFDDFLDFEKPKQIRYLHCMSVAAEIMNHIESERDVPIELLERCAVEWPLKI